MEDDELEFSDLNFCGYKNEGSESHVTDHFMFTTMNSLVNP